jgi:hypothetical protein
MCIECDDPDVTTADDCPYDADEHHPNYFYDVLGNDKSDQKYDSNYRQYNPYSGSLTPSEDRCNALLTNYDERYGEKRYCMQKPHMADGRPDNPFCRFHRERKFTMARAKDMLKHGLYSQTIAHVYENITPFKRVLALGLYDSLVDDSTFDFEMELRSHTIDFSDSDRDLPIEMEAELEDGVLPVDVPTPTVKVHRAIALWHAAVDEIKKLNINEILFEDGMIQETTIEIDGQEKTISDEHSLHLSYSRLSGDTADHLEYGGVTVDEEDDVSVNIESQDLVLEADPDPEAMQDTNDMPLHDIDG